MICPTKRSIIRFWLSALPLVAMLAAGCDVGNDNPTSASKMSEIRKKEAAGRGSFNPAPAATGQPAAPGK